VMPELVVLDERGRPEAVRYQFLSSLLLGALQDQQAELDDLRARLVAVERAQRGESRRARRGGDG
jgi:hypothetical protein